MRDGGCRPVEHELQTAAQQIGQRRAGALVRHMHEVCPGYRLEQFRRHMPDGSYTGRPVGQRARFGFRKGNKLLYGVPGHRRMNHENIRRVDQQRYRGEILYRMERQIVLQGGRNRMGAARDYHHRITVWRRLRNQHRCQHTRGAGPILHNDRLPQPFAHLGRNGARHKVRPAAGRVAHQETYRPGREILCPRTRVYSTHENYCHGNE